MFVRCSLLYFYFYNLNVFETCVLLYLSPFYFFLGDRGLDLVENHIEKALSKESIKMEVSDINENKDQQSMDEDTKISLKRPASEDIVESESKKPHLVVTTNMNGSASVGGVDSPAPESVSSSNGDDGPATVTNNNY